MMLKEDLAGGSKLQEVREDTGYSTEDRIHEEERVRT